jgi:hypothetical protein
MASPAGIATDEIKQIQDYMLSEFNALMRPVKNTLYHYTTGAAAASIIDQARLRAVNVIYMDSGQELQHRLDNLRSAMAQRPRGDASLDLNQSIEHYLSQTVSTVPPDIWVATLTEQRDSLDQWRRLEPQGHAVAIGFSPGEIVKAAKSGGVLVAPCCYDDSVKLAVVGRGLDLLERLCLQRAKRSGIDPQATQALVRYVVRELALFGALMKPPELAHENEWRLILCNPSQTALGARRIMPLPGPDFTALYVDIELGDDNGLLPVSEVLVGPGHYQQLTARGFLTLLYKHGYQKTTVTLSQTG